MSEQDPVFKLPSTVPCRSANRPVSSEGVPGFSGAKMEVPEHRSFVSPETFEGPSHLSVVNKSKSESRKRHHSGRHLSSDSQEYERFPGRFSATETSASSSKDGTKLAREASDEREEPEASSDASAGRQRHNPAYHPLIKKLAVIPTALEEYNVQQSVASSHDPTAALQLHARQRAARGSSSASNVTSLDYSIPDFSETPPDGFKIEIIKSGVMQNTVACAKPFVVVGRLPGCNIRLEHPSVSRFHAVLQYSKGTADMPPGFYIYDLESTHGTFLNKMRLKEKTYVPLKDGYVIKFGMSTRLYIFHAPQNEQQTENVGPSKSSEATCDWGFGEDANEEVLEENPFALTTNNEKHYINNATGVLKEWFNREGYDLVYDISEKGIKRYVCCVRLPIDTSEGECVIVEGSVGGSKRESVNNCALEACKVLDGHNLLMPSEQSENIQLKKEKKWEQDDFYDSDEDPYLDQTGNLEKKREWRKKMVKKQEVENYESLTVKISKIDKQIKELTDKLNAANQKTDVEIKEEMDPLDAYMLQIEDPKTVTLDAVTKSKLRNELSELTKRRKILEEMQTVAAVPSFVLKATTCSASESYGSSSQMHSDTKAEDKCENSSFGSLKGLESTEPSQLLGEAAKMTSETPATEDSNIFPAAESVSEKKSPSLNQRYDETFDMSCKTFTQEPSNILSSEERKMFTLEEKMEELPTSTGKKCVVVSGANLSLNDDYSMWLPPLDQPGDGSTHLNEKYGY